MVAGVISGAAASISTFIPGEVTAARSARGSSPTSTMSFRMMIPTVSGNGRCTSPWCRTRISLGGSAIAASARTTCHAIGLPASGRR
jgi:hypothetical protein